MISKLRDILVGAVPLAFVYFAGILYIQYYLGEFNIYFNQVELGVNDVLVYAFVTFYEPLFIIILLSVSLFLLWFHRNKNLYQNKLLVIVYAFCAIIIFFATVISAKDTAHLRANEIWEGRGAALSSLTKIEDVDKLLDPSVVLDLQKCFTRNVGIIFSDKKNTYGLCRSSVQSSKVGRVIKLNEVGSTILSWTVRR